jgi:hypothetical protein
MVQIHKTNSKDLNMKKEFSAPQIRLTRNENWYKTWNGEVLVVGNIYKVNNEFCVYAGDFKNKEDVPQVFCCYTIGDIMKVRHVKIDITQELPLRNRKKRTEDDRPIDTTSKDSDNTLMLLVKSAIQYRNITRGDFRRMYPNISDMNNILRCIEKGDILSWPRFNDLIDRMNVSYKLSVFDNETNELINET